MYTADGNRVTILGNVELTNAYLVGGQCLSDTHVAEVIIAIRTEELRHRTCPAVAIRLYLQSIEPICRQVRFQARFMIGRLNRFLVLLQ